ncbi:threonine/serine dehydratase [Spongiactinospora sp. TRM90649]|uniref:threonine/serine dehydratase n=1 Tax=Spongiactinospora sp. TRM90649 TaxID=3031114 RepID=UPI0023F80966|nr:threonine/serine dehydratase [Spongiactinospora sp. TRM90649]MDF5755656.1 threonine/serine dehydratase [Spongiactinospora sp. TRM90649]
MDVTRVEVERAAERIAGYVRRTPVIEAEPGVFLKLEYLQHAGSFKPRGAFNRILTAREAGVPPASGVIAASGGNHGLAVAYAARTLGVRAEIFVPEVTAPVKVAGLRELGAEVNQTGAVYSDAFAASLKRAAETGALDVHAYDQPEVVAGQGTLGLELREQIPGLDTVLIAVGGGGLVAGVAAALGDTAEVVAVEPERIPTLAHALTAGRPVDVEVGGVAADALGATRLGSIAHRLLAEERVARVRSVLVSDEEITEARRELWRSFRIAVEPAGAAAYAALLAGGRRPGERVAVVLCGANTDPADLVVRGE